MILGFLECFILFVIITILFGPTLYPKIKKMMAMYAMRNKRLQQVAARRRAEELARQQLRNTRIKIAAFSIGGALLLFGIVYFAVWPVPVQVNTYQLAQVGAADVMHRNQATPMQAATLSVDGYQDITQIRFYNDWLYAAAKGGKIIRVRENGTGLTELVTTGGEILSFDFDAQDNIIFTDAAYDDAGGALLKASFDGFAVTVEPLVCGGTGMALTFPTGVAVAQDGVIYFINATTLPAQSQQTALQTMRNAQIAHTQDGTLYAYNPETQQCEAMVQGLAFGAGLALSAEQDILYISQFTSASIWSVSVAARDVALGNDDTALLCDAIDGYPTGLSVAADGTIWVAVYSPKIQWLESLSGQVAWREVLLRLPQGTRDALLSYKGKGFAVALDANGEHLASYTGDDAKSPCLVTSVCTVGERIYVATADGNDFIGYYPYMGS